MFHPGTADTAAVLREYRAVQGEDYANESYVADSVDLESRPVKIRIRYTIPNLTERRNCI